MFEYLNVPEVQNNLREIFNLIHDTWSDLDAVLNKRIAETGGEPVSVADLWTLYMSVHLEVMTQRAHKWVTQHVDTLRAPLMQDLLGYQPQSQEVGKPDTKQWQLGDALHILLEISVQADHTIMIPMEGYKGYKAPENKVGPPEMHSAQHQERRAAYSKRVKYLSHKITFDRNFELYFKGEKPKELSISESIHESATEQVDAQRQTRRELRGNSLDSTMQEPWITCKRDSFKQLETKGLPKESGLAIYRMTHGQSEPEWLEFVNKLEEHTSDWGAGQDGSDSIKPYLKLHWLDGKELGFAQNDIEAAKQYVRRHASGESLANDLYRHFNEVLNNPEGSNVPPLNLQTKAFLAIDSASFASYMSNSHDTTKSSVLPGDSTRFVLAIDPEFDPEVGFHRPDESPDYNGRMRVLGSLVWGDLYAILESQSAELGDLWPLAMHHPDQIYVGPVVPIQRVNWQAQKDDQWNMMSGVMNYLGKILR